MGDIFLVGNSRSHGEIGGTSCRTTKRTAATARTVVNVMVVIVDTGFRLSTCRSTVDWNRTAIMERKMKKSEIRTGKNEGYTST